MAITRFAKPLSLALVSFLALGSVAKADSPAAEPQALASLATMVQNLGYTTTLSADKQAFAITWTGQYNYIIHFDLSNDGTLVYLYTDLETYTPAQLASLQYVKLLEASNTSDFFFSTENFPSGEDIYANAILPAAGLTPQYLRSTLSDWAGKIDASDALWDPTMWK
jgi:hypothetical protein